MVLHTLNASPASSTFDDCLRIATAADTILLLGHGVYAALRASPAAGRLQACPARVCLLAEDATAAGVNHQGSGFEAVDMAGMVQLTEQYPRQLAWY